MGRTATKWLAGCLRVPHEPEQFGRYAVSPKHLFMWCKGMWSPPEGVRIAVMVRNPREQLLSISNRAQALPSPPKTRNMFLSMLPLYLEKIDKLVDDGCPIIEYERVTQNTGELAKVGLMLNCDIDWRNFHQRTNTFPKKLNRLGPPLLDAQIKIEPHYFDWKARGNTIERLPDYTPGRDVTAVPEGGDA